MPDPLIPATNGDEYPRLLMMPDPAERAAFDATYCRRVKKRTAATETGVGGARGRAVACSLGALHGKRIDGMPFDCDRYVDRHAVRQGLIARTDLRNDSAAWLPERTARGSCQ